MQADFHSSTALVVVDAQNSFLDPAGGNYWAGVETVIDPLQVLLAAARSSGVMIVHVADRHRPNVADGEFTQLPRHCVVGDFDAEFFGGFGPMPETGSPEIVVEKRRFSAFFATDLALVLQENRIDSLVVGGVKTNVCVRATATDALGYGLAVSVVKEAVASNRENLHLASLEDIDRYIGSVVGIDEGVEMLRRARGLTAK